MRKRRIYQAIKACLRLIIFLPFLSYSQKDSEISKPSIKQTTGFIENKGQIIDQNNKQNPGVRYLLNRPGMKVQLRKTGFSYDVYSIDYKINPNPLVTSDKNSQSAKYRSDSLIPQYHFHRIDICLEGMNPNYIIETADPSTDYLNYYTSIAPKKGFKDIQQFGKITYRNIYPNIDLEFLVNEHHDFKYNFVVHPRGQISSIKLKITGPDHISLNNDTLKFGTQFGDIEELIPESYFLENDIRTDIQTKFIMTDKGVYGFTCDKIVPGNSMLIIDPTVIRLWAT